ncbi:MAG: hypothetical protein ACFFDN_30115 [Candidatus Hodarchaeota archaeon]
MDLNVFQTYDDLSIEIILNTINEMELSNIYFQKYLLYRILSENDYDNLLLLLYKNRSVFPFLNEDDRYQLIDIFMNKFLLLDYEDIIKICQNSIFGNILFIIYLIKKNRIITSENIENLNWISYLIYINDDDLYDYIPGNYKLYIKLDERVKILFLQLEKIIVFLENMFFSNLVADSQDFSNSLIILYRLSNEQLYKFKGKIYNSIISGNKELFYNFINDISEYDIQSDDDFINNYLKVHYFLLIRKIPIFFHYENIKFNNDIFNNNAFFLICKDKFDNNIIVNPYEKISIRNIVKIFDTDSEMYVTPQSYLGPIYVKDIYSFKNVQIIDKVEQEVLEYVKNLSEDEIELRIIKILEEYNKTPHGPTEKLDIWSLRLLMYNKSDLKTAGFIIKGKSYKTIYLGDIAENLIRGVDTPVNILFLVYTGNLDDRAKDYYIKQCEVHSKQFSFINLYDLTKLFVAYNVLEIP